MNTCGSPCTATYTNNRRNGFGYDLSGNLTFDGGQTFTYDAAGRQASSDFTNLQNSYDGDGLRVKRTQDGSYPALYLRSSVLGGQVVAEIDFVNGSWQWWRGYVYAGSQLLAVQSGGVFFVHEDPVTKSKRVTNTSGVIQSWVELDPYGADTSRSSNSAFQPRKFTSYERDANGTDEAMFRRYNRWHSRFDQPDPYDGSYDLTDPQSFNRYSYVQNDPVNFVDPLGLNMCSAEYSFSQCGGWEGIRGGYFGDSHAFFISEYGGLSPEVAAGMYIYNERLGNARGGQGFHTNEEINRQVNQLCLDGKCWYDGMGTIGTFGSLAWHQRGVLGPIGDFSRSLVEAIDPTGLVSATHLRRGEPTPTGTAANIGTGVGLMAGVVIPGGGLRGALNVSRLGHIFRNAVGHVNPRTLASQGRFLSLFERVATNPANSRGVNRWGNELFTQTQRNGSQVWVEIRGGQIRNAGVNLPGAHR